MEIIKASSGDKVQRAIADSAVEIRQLNVNWSRTLYSMRVLGNNVSAYKHL